MSVKACVNKVAGTVGASRGALDARGVYTLFGWTIPQGAAT